MHIFKLVVYIPKRLHQRAPIESWGHFSTKEGHNINGQHVNEQDTYIYIYNAKKPYG